jgi:hypothetical protein
LMRVQEEYKEDSCTRSFDDTFMEYYKGWSDFISMTDHIPTLKETRKKIWIMPNFSINIGFAWGRAKIQDDYMVNTPSDDSRKITEIKNHCINAGNGNMNDLFINFCSGVGWLNPPSSVAKNTNKVIFDFKGRLGIIALDYPGEDLIKYIMDLNY